MKILAMSDIVVMKWVFLVLILTNTYLDNSFDEHDPDTFNLVKPLDWHSKFTKNKELKKHK